MDHPTLRKPRHYFDTAIRPSHVTFDDGQNERQNFPWAHYVKTRWAYAEPDVLKIEIGDWLIVIHGFNLAALYLAIEEPTLARVRAQPDLAKDHEHAADTFATEIHFVKAENSKRKGQLEIDLGLD